MGKLQSRRFAMVVDLQSLTSYESPPVSVVEVDRSKEEISRTIAIGYVPRYNNLLPFLSSFFHSSFFSSLLVFSTILFL